MWPIVGLFVIAGITHLGCATRKIVRAAEQLDRLRVGYDGEVATGQKLDRLMRQGAYVYHDVPAERFNIDHVVVSPQGMFAVETKGFRRPTGAARTLRVSSTQEAS